MKDRLIAPEPTLSDPLSQIDFVFKRVAQVKTSSKGNILDCMSFYKRVYISATNNFSAKLKSKILFYIREEWDSFALLKFQSFLDAYNVEGSASRISSATVVSHVTSFGQVLKYAALHDLTEGEYIHRVACAPVQAETTQHAAYSDREMDALNSWLKAILERNEKILDVAGYTITGLGKDPRAPAENKSKRKLERLNNAGWNSIDDLIWYFENVMHCQASCRPVHYSQRHYWFYCHASRQPGGYLALLRDWQVKPVVDLEIIMPLALKLSLETGLNPSSLWNLTVDCYQDSHPLTGVPYLQYYKARSRGNMEMHINIYDKDLTIREFKEGQAGIIKRTIARIKEITEPLRREAPAGYANYLFLFQNTGKNGSVEAQTETWKVRHIDDQVSSCWCIARAEEEDLQADNGSRLQLTVGRFRSTKITEMVRLGVDFFEIQSRFGHKSIFTTFRYLARHKLETRANREIGHALESIHKNVVWQQEQKPMYVGTGASNGCAVVYKGIMADCRNVYDPPEEIRRAKDYQPSQACTRYNMCLFCKNVVLMRHHLPMLMTYQRQIKESLGFGNGDLPNIQHYQRTLDVLDALFNPEKSEFSLLDIEWARAASESIDNFIDPVVYQAIDQLV